MPAPIKDEEAKVLTEQAGGRQNWERRDRDPMTMVRSGESTARLALGVRVAGFELRGVREHCGPSNRPHKRCHEVAGATMASRPLD